MSQLVDDLLDFISCENIMGKPASADLKLGLATAPVLFAAHQVSLCPLFTVLPLKYLSLAVRILFGISHMICDERFAPKVCVL